MTACPIYYQAQNSTLVWFDNQNIQSARFTRAGHLYFVELPSIAVVNVPKFDVVIDW